MTKEKQTEASGRAHDEMLRRARMLYEGISEEAMELLRARAQMSLPVFRDCEVLANGAAVPMDAQVLALRAAVRDGEQGFVKWVEYMRSVGKKHIDK